MATTHAICVQARHEDCNWCHAAPEQACVADRPGVHLCRICLAAVHGTVTRLDAVSVIHEMATEHEDGMFAGWELVLDVVAS